MGVTCIDDWVFLVLFLKENFFYFPFGKTILQEKSIFSHFIYVGYFLFISEDFTFTITKFIFRLYISPLHSLETDIQTGFVLDMIFILLKFIMRAHTQANSTHPVS